MAGISRTARCGIRLRRKIASAALDGCESDIT
jgi:hypothetical protein